MYEILCLQRQHLKLIEYNIGDEINKEPYAKNMAGSLPPYQTFDYASNKSNAVPDGNDGSQENLFVGLKIENDDRNHTVLLHYAIESVYDIYDAEKGATEATYAATK